ncbi:MAG: hypothetical protein JWP91_592 [Fibrobacteres bacterium]|nr:hypothetical protein [Fibrobacterota bacterium]
MEFSGLFIVQDDAPEDIKRGYAGKGEQPHQRKVD